MDKDENKQSTETLGKHTKDVKDNDSKEDEELDSLLDSMVKFNQLVDCSE